MIVVAFCEQHQAERDAAARVLGLPEHYEEELYRIPKIRVSVEPEEVKAWYERHRHPVRTAIGGVISRTETPTSIGTIETMYCSRCREHAYVNHPF